MVSRIQHERVTKKGGWVSWGAIWCR